MAPEKRNGGSHRPDWVLSNAGIFTEWAGKITACRNSGQPVKTWCKENGVCEQTYYKWLKRLVTMAQEQQKVQFAEVTPALPARSGNVTVTIRIGGVEVDACNGADAATVETVLRILKSC